MSRFRINDARGMINSHRAKTAKASYLLTICHKSRHVGSLVDSRLALYPKLEV